MNTMPPLRCSVVLLLLLARSAYCSKPSLQIIPADGAIYLGESKYFLCKANVETTLKWLTSDDEVISNEESLYEIKEIDEVTNGLTVTASKVELEPIIKCQAETSSGETSTAELKLRVIKKPQFVKDKETRKEFTADSVAQLPCAVEGIPPPQVTWFRHEIAITNLPGHLSATKDGTLTISKIQLSDAGMYFCQAYIRDRNEIAYKNVSVTVNAAPVVRFQNPLVNLTSKSNASFICFVTGHPEPQITWKKGEEPVTLDGQKYVLSSNSLELSITDLETSDEGEYTCHASNRLGEHNTTLVLQVINPPQGVGAGLIAGIVLLIFLVTLLAVDLNCYRTRRRGFLMYFITKVLGRSSPRAKLEETDIKKVTSSHVVNISGIDA
ncbi:neural cell adhesion molecule 1-like [Pseudophryne corroboree]|uniref:neural cell adhesion molecule 1-like n=1 Tax=Pseudophryne corroboree TaxID=495146 RepID=UPI003082116C